MNFNWNRKNLIWSKQISGAAEIKENNWTETKKFEWNLMSRANFETKTLCGSGELKIQTGEKKENQKFHNEKFHFLAWIQWMHRDFCYLQVIFILLFFFLYQHAFSGGYLEYCKVDPLCRDIEVPCFLLSHTILMVSQVLLRQHNKNKITTHKSRSDKQKKVKRKKLRENKMKMGKSNFIFRL